MNSVKPHLIFVYNADSGLFNTVADIAHKILSPETYSCQLCALTHSYFSIRKDWAGFLSEIDAELEFLHKDEFNKKYTVSDLSLPVILLNKEEKLSTWISSEEINHCPSLTELKAMISRRLQQA